MLRRRTSSGTAPVNGSGRFVRLQSNDLLDMVESSIGLAGREISKARGTAAQLGQQPFHLDRCRMNLQQALEALNVLVSRDVS